MQGSRSTANPLATGLEWQAKGWEVTPIPYRQKDPPPKGTTGADGVGLSGPDLWDIAEHHTLNYGLRLPVTVVGIDVDDYDGKDGAATLRRLEAEHGPLPLTYVITSREPGTSGVRLYRCPVEPDRQGLGRGIDVIRHSHRYVVGVGSVHPSGNVYRLYRQTPDGWVEESQWPSPDDPPYLPAEWVDVMGQREEREPGEGVEALPEGAPCAELIRLSVPRLVAGGSRHDAYASAVFNVVGKAAQGHTGALGILARMRDEFHRDVKDRPVYGEFDRMVEGAKAKARPAEEACFGAECHRDSFMTGEGKPRQGGPDSEPTEETGPLWADLSWVNGGERPPIPAPEFAARDDGHCLFYTGALNGVFGDPETGKTWLVMVGGVEALADGKRFAFIDTDNNGQAMTVDRLLALGVKPEVIADPARFRYYEPNDKETLRAVIAEVTGWEYVVLDSLGEATPMLGRKSNDTDDMTIVMRIISPPARVGCMVTVDHLPKDPEARQRGAIGSIAKKRAMRGAYLRMEKRDHFAPGREGVAYVRIEKDTPGGVRRWTNDGEYVGTFVLDATGPRLHWRITSPVVGTVRVEDTEIGKKVLSALDVRDTEGNYKWLTATDVRELTSRSYDDCKKVLAALADQPNPPIERDVSTTPTGRVRLRYRLRVEDEEETHED